MSLPVKIVTPVGSIGMGFDPAKLYEGLKLGATAIIADAGSTDSGPQKLALGVTMCPHDAYVEDFEHIVDACWHHKVKVLISSAGGDGSNKHVDEFVDIIEEHCQKKNYRLKVTKIYAEIDRDLIKKSIDQGLITPCGYVPALEKKEVDAATTIVAQMGLEPFVEALKENPDVDIIIAGRAYDPAPYAGYCVDQGIKNLGTAYHMGKVMECGAHAGTPKSREAFATVWDDRFEMLPLQGHARCTAYSLASHSLYENARGDYHPGPGGAIDLTKASFYPTEGRSGGSTGAVFQVADTYTVKLEGAKVTGYRTITQGSIRDPILISQLNDWLAGIEAFIKERFKKIDFQIMFRSYGLNGTMGPLEPDHSHVPKEIFLLCDVVAETQELADKVAALARVACVHGAYPGQVATAGNLAMPVTPLHIPLGQISEFNIYHLLPVSDPAALFPRHVSIVGVADDSTAPRNLEFGYDLQAEPPLLLIQKGQNSASNGEHKSTAGHTEADRTNGANGTSAHITEGEGPIPLLKLAKVIRSKNAGPFELTFDIIFNDEQCFNYAQKSPALGDAKLAKLYHITEMEILASHFFKPALAFKFTIPRPWIAGGFGERDVHCSQQHAPLLDLEL
ncbi:uncharacterized protein A1O9_02308 [Exophiala aquamarina CBS 119918]|uniref:3-methylaspartate ammonia-lyase n=1 Tax=Exophiala aquamarina CBS 119918 TaxID=1182545 RepID=A0A072PLZ0_9EURO|nr:uncharacterized protein A1O9_02308 [Exophiala aquamarina CBS 119918]KEF60747.1 hypothetical protein A1O9_02308 [Exophiala aquamarina CBS 119918]